MAAQHSNMVTSFGFQATAVWPPFVSGLGAGWVCSHS